MQMSMKWCWGMIYPYGLEWVDVTDIAFTPFKAMKRQKKKGSNRQKNMDVMLLSLVILMLKYLKRKTELSCLIQEAQQYRKMDHVLMPIMRMVKLCCGIWIRKGY